MTISYNWLCDYLPVTIEPERLSRILTAIGLEVESVEPYESVKGSLSGLVIGEVITCTPHPNADKLKLTTVNTGEAEPLQIVCGAPNVAAGQKVIVAPVGTTIYPVSGDPLTMKVAKIRGVESYGMICAEDEIGLGSSHAGIIILPDDVRVGTPAAGFYHPYQDTLFEIGLTPNRMDAMSHIGVARDVCAYLSHHDKKEFRVKRPSVNGFKVQQQQLQIAVEIGNSTACGRYCGLSLTGIRVGPSPQWLKDRLLSIGVRPINNIVDITNFVLHETGQPLHAFDADAITGNKVVVKTLPEGSTFVTLDGKERKLSAEDLMICNSETPMCIAGVFGGIDSGVTESTTRIFLESAWFHPTWIRKTSFRHGLRTDAATRFEKGVDISQTVNVLKRAALLMADLAGGTVASEIIDVYPAIQDRKQVAIKYHYLKKLSGKNYHPDTVKKILESLGFEVMKDGIDELWVAVPYSKPDISIPADIVEEILRIDGLDNVTIPTTISISPSVEKDLDGRLREKVAAALTGAGFNEILTNSISNSAWYAEDQLKHAVRMLNNLSVELDVLRPAMLETGLAVLAHNLNRKNASLQLFEWGKTYSSEAVGSYQEQPHCCLYMTGSSQGNWRKPGSEVDFFGLKGILNQLAAAAGQPPFDWESASVAGLRNAFQLKSGKSTIGFAGQVSKEKLAGFDIKQQVFFADLDWMKLVTLAGKKEISFQELPKQLPVHRDLALLVDKTLPYAKIETAIRKTGISRLRQILPFDLFESDKLGQNRKSVAVSFMFLDEEKTMTDKEIDNMMQKIINTLEQELGAEIRK
ncbi:phenylalanine--tRNA ligase subunit beta [Flavihumibacter petaseus]|uniref:Phenylalanine--tRNA ligase beta subunit n=1 Tax=Flavihumibacter petaseus NBRC 106054 TaxID=1220578 RepID=A0A0E9N6N2_9BACT|nr:phenylalanine--tRNA ligase subunit beta [Flavihumibacter petaseus]GAO45005.1 phenylalanyl-tRNA synthetase beta subunit [Flavihumibacter petaseus NBRC 106054]